MIINLDKNINTNKNMSFKAGMNDAVKRMFAYLSAPNIEDSFKTVYGVDAKFNNNRAAACCAGTVADIFSKLSEFLGVPFSTVPPKIRMFTPGQTLIENVDDAIGFCIPNSCYVLKNEPVFELRSLFFNDKYKTFTDIDRCAEEHYRGGWSSSNHFLHTHIHEWVHNIHTDLLYRLFGYDGTCPMALQRYNSLNGRHYDPNPFISGLSHQIKMQNMSYTPEASKIIKKQISTYAAGETNPQTGKFVGGNPMEVVAEFITKKVTEVLHPDTLMPTHNPFYYNNKEDSLLIDIFLKAWNGILR